MKREFYLKEIIEEFGILRNKIEMLSQVNLQDINIISEYHIQEILNILFDLQLTNSNEYKQNFKAIDLQDPINAIAIQVTANSRKSKVQETLDKFFEDGLDSDFETLIIFILGKKQLSYKNLKVKEGFLFIPDEHILDFSKIISKLSFIPTGKLEKIRNILKEDRLAPKKKISDVTIFKKKQIIRKKIVKSLINTSNDVSDAIFDYYDPSYKFKYEKIIIRSIVDQAYPFFDDPITKQRADWYKVFSFDLNENFLEVQIQYYDKIVVNKMGEWNYLGDREEDSISNDLKIIRTDVIERISLEHIIEIDLTEEDPIIFVDFQNGKAHREQIPFIRGYYKNDSDYRKTYYFELHKQDINL